MNVVRLCPLCQGTYADDVRTCPADGRTLVVLADAERRLVGTVLGGKYTVQAPLGRGGIGVVFRAWQHGMERPVALKVLRRGLLEDETAVRRFLREIQGAGRVSHPHVVTAFDHGQGEEGELFLVMELLEGRTLGDLLAKEGPLPAPRAVALLAGMCDGLHAAHEAGVIHRDVKPENALVLPDTGPSGEFVKVVDFGLAQLKAVAGAESITRTGQICGTPPYMSPEQILDQGVDRRTDVYALGVVAWQALVGRLPFTGDTAMAILLGHLHQPAPPLALHAPGVPAGVAAAVMAALEKDPARRPPTALAFKQALLAGLEARPGAATAGGPPGALGRALGGALGGETLDSLSDVPAAGPTVETGELLAPRRPRWPWVAGWSSSGRSVAGWPWPREAGLAAGRRRGGARR
ncbi:MAG: serine/threonine-protein kinase [bacterium]